MSEKLHLCTKNRIAGKYIQYRRLFLFLAILHWDSLHAFSYAFQLLCISFVDCFEEGLEKLSSFNQEGESPVGSVKGLRFSNIEVNLGQINIFVLYENT